MKASTLRGLVAGATLALGFAVLAPTKAEAQGMQFGVAASYADDSDFGVGAFAKFHLADVSNRAIGGRIGFDYFFPGNDATAWSLNGDALLNIATNNASMKPYIGAGVGYRHFGVGGAAGDACDTFNLDCSSSDVGLNLIGGLNFGKSKMMPFVEAKLEVGDGSQFVVKAGIHF